MATHTLSPDAPASASLNTPTLGRRRVASLFTGGAFAAAALAIALPSNGAVMPGEAEILARCRNDEEVEVLTIWRRLPDDLRGAFLTLLRGTAKHLPSAPAAEAVL